MLKPGELVFDVCIYRLFSTLDVDFDDRSRAFLCAEPVVNLLPADWLEAT